MLWWKMVYLLTLLMKKMPVLWSLSPRHWRSEEKERSGAILEVKKEL